MTISNIDNITVQAAVNYVDHILVIIRTGIQVQRSIQTRQYIEVRISVRIGVVAYAPISVCISTDSIHDIRSVITTDATVVQ